MERQNIGKYEIRGILGRGHTGAVYDGWDTVIQRRVAIKTLALPDASTPEGQDRLLRFRRESHVSGSLSHPNIITIHDYGEAGDIAYIVMEFIDGTDPVTFLKQRSTSSSEAVRIIRDVLAALQFSHEHGVVHRDIKPSNIMVTAAGHVKIGDFGVARTEDSRLTQLGTQIGTPAYMSPEQLTGEPADARSDVYSTGVVLYQLLTGEKPFAGSLTSIIHKVLHTVPPRPSALSLQAPPALDAIVERAMARRPPERYRTAAEFSAALAAATVNSINLPAGTFTPAETDIATTIVSPRIAPTTTDDAALKKRHKVSALILGIVLLVAAFASGWIYMGSSWPPFVTEWAQLTGSPSGVSASTAPKAEPILSPPGDGKTLAEAIMVLIPLEKQASQRANVEEYAKNTSVHRALAISPAGLTWWAVRAGTAPETAERALEGCEIVHGGACATAAIDATVLQGTLVRRPMSRVAYSGPFDRELIPTVRPPRLREADVAGYKTAEYFKAMAIHPWGRVFVAIRKSSQQTASDASLAACEEDPERHGRDETCYLYAEGNTVVLMRRIAGTPRPPAEALGPELLLEPLVFAFSPLNLRANARIFLTSGLNRAMAVNPETGYSTWWSRRASLIEAEGGALEQCELNSGSACHIAAVNNEIRAASAPVVSQTRVTYSGPFDPLQIPAIGLLERSSAHVTEYGSAPAAKALAINPTGRAYTTVGKASQVEAADTALDDCNRDNSTGGPCYLYASGDQIVLASRRTRATTGVPPPAR